MSAIVSGFKVDVLREFDRDTVWFRKNMVRFRKRYPNEFVAVRKKRLVDHDPDLQSLIQRLTKEYKDLRPFVIEFVGTEKYQLTL